METQKAKHACKAYYLAAQRCFEERTISKTEMQMLLFPGIHNMMISIHAGLLAILGDTTEQGEKTEIDVLFSRTDAQFQKLVLGRMGMNTTAFSVSLAQVTQLFSSWQYPYAEVLTSMPDRNFFVRLGSLVFEQA